MIPVMKITLTIIFIVFIAIFGFAGAVWIGFKDNRLPAKQNMVQ